MFTVCDEKGGSTGSSAGKIRYPQRCGKPLRCFMIPISIMYIYQYFPIDILQDVEFQHYSAERHMFKSYSVAQMFCRLVEGWNNCWRE